MKSRGKNYLGEEVEEKKEVEGRREEVEERK
jgi:hypothetical protein